MDLDEHKKKFQEVVKRYNLDREDTAREISLYLTQTPKISVSNFSEEFNIDLDDAKIFLSFIVKGIEFKEKNLK